MNISIVCSLGLGTSFIIKVNLEKILKKMNINADVNHTDLTTAQSICSDLYITTVLHDLKPPYNKAEVIFIENVLDMEELEKKFLSFWEERGSNE